MEKSVDVFSNLLTCCTNQGSVFWWHTLPHKTLHWNIKQTSKAH